LDYSWTRKDGVLYLFASYDGLIYMPLPPLGRVDADTLGRGFALMRERNRNPLASRVEQIDPRFLPLYEKLGYSLSPGSMEYLYRTEDLVLLKGDRYKSRRADCNAFIRVFGSPPLEPFSSADRKECLELWLRWAAFRRSSHADPYYRSLLDDAEGAHRYALRHHQALGLRGWVVRIDRRIRGYAFGFPRGTNTFCILFEIADPTCKGLPAYLFRELSREVRDYPIVNTLDDSGLENLRRTKLSYHPWKTVAPYVLRET
jgi:hypothetical protein